MTKGQKFAQLGEYLGHALKFQAAHTRQHQVNIHRESGGGGYDFLGPEGLCCISFQLDVEQLTEDFVRLARDDNHISKEGYQWFELTPEVMATGIQSSYRPQLAGVLRHGGPIDGRLPAKQWRYSSYTCTWSRVIWLEPEELGSGWSVEVNLTPKNRAPSLNEWRDNIAQIEIRRHCTAPTANDRDVDELPAEVVERMVENLGSDLTNRLLTEDFFTKIDWALYRELPTGPRTFESCRKR